VVPAAAAAAVAAKDAASRKAAASMSRQLVACAGGAGYQCREEMEKEVTQCLEIDPHTHTRFTRRTSTCTTRISSFCSSLEQLLRIERVIFCSFFLEAQIVWPVPILEPFKKKPTSSGIKLKIRH